MLLTFQLIIHVRIWTTKKCIIYFIYVLYGNTRSYMKGA